jgi:glycosyltransferase involved in cell wall biosynthesis
LSVPADRRPVRVCIDARNVSAIHSGVRQVLTGLARGLSELDDEGDEYLFLSHPDDAEFLSPHLGGGCRTIHADRAFGGRVGRLARRARERARSRRGHQRISAAAGHEAEIAAGILEVSDGTAESSGADLIHFPLASGFLTDLPSIYSPYDLQHLHHPEFFSEEDVRLREVRYPTYCEQASLTFMMTSSGKRDVVERYGLSPERVAVVPMASVLLSYPSPTADDLDRVRRELELPERFLLFPSQTFPHKNHLGLLEALALLRDERGMRVPVVCPGKQSDFFPQIAARAEELDLADALLFPGFVTTLQLRSLYSLAAGLIFPSRYEGWGLPVTEAFAAGLPVACSELPAILDMAGDAVVTFDPERPAEIAASIARLWEDPELARSLAEKGKERGKLFSWDYTARLFRAHYRRIAGRQLGAEDEELLAAPPRA